MIDVFSYVNLQELEKARSRARQTLSPLTVKWALQKILPYPCKQHYISVTLIPETNRFRLLKHQLKTQLKEKYYGRYMKVLALSFFAHFFFPHCKPSCFLFRTLLLAFLLTMVRSYCADCGQGVEGFCQERHFSLKVQMI